MMVALARTGAVLYITYLSSGAAQLKDFWVFSPDVFFYGLLPPIIFEAGYSLKRRLFFNNIVPILTFAIIGTLISTAFTGAILIAGVNAGWMKQLGADGPASVKCCLLFASLISAVDPVATLAVMAAKELNADARLQAVLFGESVLNDAVAIVLFQSLSKSGNIDSPSGVADFVLEFFKTAFCSTFMGAAIALVLSLLFRNALFHEHAVHLEGALTVSTAYISYAAAEAVELSGVLSLFFCGVVLGHYNWYNLSHAGKLLTGHVCQALAFACETFVFALLGINLFDPQVWKLDWGFLGLAFAGCLVGRALNIFPLSFAMNITCGTRLGLPMQVVLWFSGLRGAIAFALANNLNVDEEYRQRVLSVTMLVVLATTLGLGGLTAPVVRFLGLSDCDETGSRAGSMPDVSSQQVTRQPLLTSASPASQPSGIRHMWRHVDRTYLQHWFGGAAGLRKRPRGDMTRQPSLRAGASQNSNRRIARLVSQSSRLPSSRLPSECSWQWGCSGSVVAEASHGAAGVAQSGGSQREESPPSSDDDSDGEEARKADEIFWLVRTGSNDPFIRLPQQRAHSSHEHRQPAPVVLPESLRTAGSCAESGGAAEAGMGAILE